MELDYRAPNYSAIFAKRHEHLKKLRADPKCMQAAKIHYRTHPWDFVGDWGITFDPRNIAKGLLATMPFVPWTRQVEYMEWLYGMWQASQRGVCEKSRDCGVTWLSVGFAVSMFLFEPGFTMGFGSRKEDLVDKSGDEKSIFEKVRIFIDSIPVDFMPVGWNDRCSARMRISNPVTGAAIIGESGDQIGRGGRTSMYLVDEAAFVEHQGTVDSALSQNTDCQIDVSSVNSSGNEFYRKRMRLDGTPKLFIFDWRQDPRKDQAWHDKMVSELDPVIVAQEIDRDYNASTEDAFIPGKWVAACIDAHKRLGIEASGLRVTGFDPADVGDAKATVSRYGPIITQAEQLVGGDITQAIPWAFEIADRHRADILRYDGDGMGAPTMKLALQIKSAGRMKVLAYHGSAAVEDPDKLYGTTAKKDENAKRNIDMFTNYRSQTWTWARDRFKATYDAVQRQQKGFVINVNPDMLVSLDSTCVHLTQLQSELSRPKRIFTPNGKIKVESKADMKARQVDSPNLADACIIALATKRPPEPDQFPIIQGRQILDKGMAY